MGETERIASIQKSFADLRLWEPHIDAWSHVVCPSDDPVEGAIAGPLSGFCFGVKDVIDVAGLPTRFGSRLYADAPPAVADAPVVAALRNAGAVPIGKTRTTEFAFVDPTSTRNPYDLRRSPGGSSSGSGAAVGARVIPFALGTQTAGSLCRPASYCGAVSYKPGLGRFPTSGMAPLSPSFDAIGVIACSMDWLQNVFEVLNAAFDEPEASASTGSLRIGMMAPSAQMVEPDMAQAMTQAIAAIRVQGHRVELLEPPVDFAALIAWHRTIMLREAIAVVGPLVAGGEDRLGPKLAAGLREGQTLTDHALTDAIARIHEARSAFWRSCADFDLLLAYPVPGAAPVGLTTTGDQSYLTPWTALAGPLVSVCAGLDGRGMPLGLLLAAAPGRDRALIEMSRRIARLLPEIPDPIAPTPRLRQ